MTAARRALLTLILHEPFFASLLLPLKLVESDRKAWVNGIELGFNREWWDTLTPKQARTVMAHEALHLALLHHLRWPIIQLRYGAKADFFLWNQACDYAINLFLTDVKWDLPSDALLDHQYENMSAEEIYAKLHKEKEEEQKQDEGKPKPNEQGGQEQDGEGTPDSPSPSPSEDPADNGEGGAGTPETPPPSDEWGQVEQMPLPPEADLKEEEQKMRQAVQQAVNAAKGQGTIPAGLKEAFDKLVEPKVSWADMLSRWYEDKVPSDWSFSRPNAKFIMSGISMPILESEGYGSIVGALDTSGSMGLRELERAVSEMLKCAQTYEDNGQEPSIPFIYCDAEVNDEFVITEEADIKDFSGRGGTLFTPVFERVAEWDREQPKGLIYITDGYGNDFPEEPDYDVVWLLTPEGCSVESFGAPWGEVIKMEDE